MVMYNNEYKRQENKIRAKDAIEPQHVHIHVYGYIGITTTYIYMGIWVYIDA